MALHKKSGERYGTATDRGSVIVIVPILGRGTFCAKLIAVHCYSSRPEQKTSKGDEQQILSATCRETRSTISFALVSLVASATTRIIGSVFEPLTRNQPSGSVTLIPSLASIGNLPNSCRTILSTAGIRWDGQASFCLTML